MTEVIRVLIVEDLPTDAELSRREVQHVLPECEFLRIETRENFLAALESFRPDIILSDYKLPHFDGMTALKLAQEHAPEIPFILITGSINEETAVECMKAGAWDYVIKEHIKRLGPAVLSGLEQKRLRREQRLAQEALRESESRYRDLVENSGDLVCTHDLDGAILSVNQAALKTLGYSAAALLKMNLGDILAPIARGRLSVYLARLRRHGAARGLMRVQTASGEERIWEYNNTLRTHDVPAPLARGMARDITEQKRAEEKLARREAEFCRLSQEFHALLDAIPDNLTLQSPELRVLWANNGAAAGLNKKPEDLVGTYCYELWHNRNEPCESCPVLKSFRTGERAIETITTPDGRTWDLRTVPLKDASGKIINVIEMGRDITEHRRLEEQLIHAQKLEGIGQLAGGIAHDFNNVLNAVVGFAGLLQMQMDKADPLKHYADEIMTAGQRGAMLTHQILAFSRKQVLDMKPANLNEITRSLEKMLHRLVREDISIEMKLFDNNLVVMADASQIDQVVINLVTNARDAMPKGGRIGISTEHFVMDNEYVGMHGYGSPGEYALLTVSDTGCGMNAEIRAHIFEPFFTTKEVGKGTGLGLAVVHGIVKQHSGYINVYSEAGRGTIFKIYLPLTEGVAGGTEAKQEAQIRGGTESVLIAEDDDSLRKLSRTVLEHYGYHVIEAVNGEDAIRKFIKNRNVIKLVILDGIMPRKNGGEAFDAIRKICPDMKTIFMSGYAEDIFSHDGIPDKEAVFIQKPVSPDNLLRKVRETLDG